LPKNKPKQVFKAISRSRAAQHRTEKRFGGAIATFRSVRSVRAAKGNSPQADQVNGCLFFWFVFFGQAKKMNKQEVETE